MINPKIRFKRDDGSEYLAPIEQPIIEICGKVSSGKSKASAGDYPLYGSTGVIGTCKEGNYKGAKILIARVGANAGKTQLVLEECGVTDNTLVLNVPNNIAPYWLLGTLEHYNLSRMISGSGQPLITGGDIQKTRINFPCLEEQQKIADFLSSVDDIISASEAEVKNLEEQKKGVMQKIFSQEVRFKADDGSEYPEWTNKTFEEAFDNLGNNTLSRSKLNYENPSVRNIHYGDILVLYGSNVDATDTRIPFITETKDCISAMKHPLQHGDIVIADTAEDETAGKVVEIVMDENADIVAGLHTIPCRPRKREFASKYLGYYMNSAKYHNQLIPLMQGTKVTSISKSAIKDSVVDIPCLEEQQKIADFLSTFDEAIEQSKKELEKWKELKKGLLQQMFV